MANNHLGNGSNNPDPKPSIKQFIQSPNRSSRNGAAITMVVLHCTEATLKSTLTTFKDGSPKGRQVSAHYVIDRNGDIYQMVVDAERANHCKGANSNSIGIEHVASPTQTMTQAQQTSSVALLRWLLQQYDVSPLRVFGHDFAPGYTGDGTSCPDALFGAHTQSAVQAWVQTNVINSSGQDPLADPAPQPDPGTNLRVTASSLNVRMAPTLDGTIIGSLARDSIVGWLKTSADQYWAKVQGAQTTGWASRRFLESVAPAAAAAAAAAVGGSVQSLLAIAEKSAIARYNWVKRGVAPIGYIKGMALVYARMYCKLKAGDPGALEMAKANTGDSARDALAHYAAVFHSAGMDNDSSGVSTLRHLFVLMMGLGMRESSGQHCVGVDTTADGTPTAETAEAGLFQTSYNARRAHPLMPILIDRYTQDFAANPAVGFLDVFKEKVTCSAADWKNIGSGRGKDFQDLSKRCPAFAAEYCGVGLRNTRKHWGTINSRAAEVHTDANILFMRVEQEVDAGNLCPL